MQISGYKSWGDCGFGSAVCQKRGFDWREKVRFISNFGHQSDINSSSSFGL